MILIGIFGLVVVLLLYVLVYLFFIKRTDRFMDAWEKEMKERIEKTMAEGKKALEEASEVIKASRKPMEELEEAAQAIKASRETMEKFVFEKGFISKPISEESLVPKTITETQAKPITISTATPYFTPSKDRKREKWVNWIYTEPAFS